jgi:hypothetical protein
MTIIVKWSNTAETDCGCITVPMCIKVCVGVDHTVQNELCQEDARHTKVMCGVIK